MSIAGRVVGSGFANRLAFSAKNSKPSARSSAHAPYMVPRALPLLEAMVSTAGWHTACGADEVRVVAQIFQCGTPRADKTMHDGKI